MQAQICLLVNMNENFLIPINGLVTGKTQFSWFVNKEFFEYFDNSEILDAELQVEAIAEKSGTYIGIDCQVDGYITIECDRCLEPLNIPIEVDIRLSVKYGIEEFAEDEEDFDNLEDSELSDAVEDRELVFLEQDAADLDMRQVIYDYVYLSLPIQRVHPEGECNPEILKHLMGFKENEIQKETEEEFEEEQQEDNPFASLKDLFKN